MNGATILETMLRRDRVVVMGALGVIAGLAWAYIGYLAVSYTHLTLPTIYSV